MPRTLLAFAALAGAVAFPAPADALCLDTTAVGGVCQSILRCGPGSPVTVYVLGSGTTGTASCGGATASCTAFLIPFCTQVAIATSSGTMSCNASGGGDDGVAICVIGISAR